jgi:formate dehydrogenase major subunit
MEIPGQNVPVRISKSDAHLLLDPRFTRTSAVADIYAPVRAGSDIAFLGGVINYVLNSEKWNKDPFFKTFVVNYTNAATINRRGF